MNSLATLDLKTLALSAITQAKEAVYEPFPFVIATLGLLALWLASTRG